MSKINSARPSCKDVFNSFLVSDSKEYDGYLEIPYIYKSDCIPNKLISFTKSFGTSDYNQWVHFYEDDAAFERFWRNPNKYLEHLSKFNGVISIDASLYRDMPLVMQQWNVYRNRAIGHWLQSNGINVIPNVRIGDRRSHSFACLGLETGGTIAMGSHGCMKIRTDRLFFLEGFRFVIEELNPKRIVIYGTVCDEMVALCTAKNIELIVFESDFAKSRKAVK